MQDLSIDSEKEEPEVRSRVDPNDARSQVVITALVAYHAVVLCRSLRGPRGEVRGELLATGERRPCPPYLCQVGRMTADSPMLVLGRAQSRRVSHVVGSAVRGRRDMAAMSTFVISFPSPPLPEKTFSRLLIWVPKMRSYNEPSGCSEDRLVFDQDELNFGDLAEGPILGTNPGDLAERLISGTNLRDLAKEPISGINPWGLAENVISSTNLGGLVEEPISGTNPGDFTEEPILGINLGDLAEK
ncbi:hypothetical protein BHE74_00044429, partial [Ensete ventricosum]